MVDDNDARNAVRSLMERFELINSQRLGLAYVLAKKDRDAYETLLAETEDAIEKVIRPLMEADAEHQQVLATLSDSEANWPAAIMHMLSTSVRYEHRGQWRPTPPEGFQET
jgi:hypothetical protein